MNSLVNEFVYTKSKKNKKSTSGFEPCINYCVTVCHTTINLLNADVFYNIFILILYMILMSEKMTSQTITDEFIYVSVRGNERNT